MVFRTVLFIIFLSILWLLFMLPVIPLIPLGLIMLLLKRLEELTYKFMYGAMHFKIEETPWLYDGPRNRAIINCLLMLDDYLDIKTFQSLIDTKLVFARDKETGRLLYPRITKYVHPGYLNFYWKEEANFQLSDHVYEWSENPCQSKTELEDLVSSFAERPLITDDHKSPWEYVLIHCKDSDGHKRTAILDRSNHALADGSSQMYFLINRLCGDSENNEYLSGNGSRLTETEKNMIRLKACFYFPYNIVRSLIPKFKRATSFDCASLSGKKRLIYTKPISLDLVKTIKRQLNVTVNDVMVGCIATSLHNYFRSKNEKAPPKFIACLPLDTRLSIEEAKEFSNKINITQIALPTENADPIKSIHDVHKSMQTTKSNLEAMSMRFGLRFAASFAPLFIVQKIIRTSLRQSAMVVSNIQGPSKELRLAGRKMKFLVFWPPGKDQVASGISIFSYNGSIFVGVGCDETVTKYPEHIIKDLPRIITSLAESMKGLNDSD